MASIDDLDTPTRLLLQKYLTEAEITAAIAMPGGIDILKRIAARIKGQQAKQSNMGALIAFALLLLASEGR